MPDDNAACVLRRSGEEPMTDTTVLASRPAEHGQKTVEVTIKFWTNDIAEQSGDIVPKHVRSSGVVNISTNDAHGIRTENPVPFNSIAEIPKVIEDMFIEYGVTVHPSRKMRKYFQS